MSGITKRTLLGAGAVLTASAAAATTGSAIAASPGGSFISNHSGVFNGGKIDYVATVGETILSDANGRPAMSFVCTSYALAGADPAKRPVLFAFNGGPSSASAALHMLSLGPKRLLVAEPNAPASPPALVDNTTTVLDVTDLVFVDPAESGFSRVLPGGDHAYFHSIEGDTQSVADFIVAWCKVNGREVSPKFVLGESYGTQRATWVAGHLAKVLPLDGVYLLSQAVNIIETSQRAKNVLGYATNLPALCSIAVYHGRAPMWHGKPMSKAIEEAYAFGMGEYLQALLRGDDLPSVEKRSLAQHLEAMTGISANYYLAHGLVITKAAYARELLRDQNGILGTFDARYVGPTSPPGQREADPFSRAIAGVQSMLAQHFTSDLRVTWPMSDYRPNSPESHLWTWDGTGAPGGPFLDYDYQSRLNAAFVVNPRFRLMIGGGVYDLTTTVGPAKYLIAQSEWPRDRVFRRQYLGGHMSYTNDPSHTALMNDVRALVAGRDPGPMMSV